MFRGLLQHHRVVLVGLRWHGLGWGALYSCTFFWSGRGSGWRGLFLAALRRFLFLFLLFRLLLDAGQLAQDLHALFGCLAATGQLHSENLVHDGVELCAARKAQSFQFVRNRRQRRANWPPFVQIGANLRERGGIGRFRKQVRQAFYRKLFQELVSVRRRIELASDQFLLVRMHLLLEVQYGVCFGRTESRLGEDGALFPVLDATANRQHHRRRKLWTNPGSEQILTNFHQTRDGVVVRMPLREHGTDGFEQVVLLPLFQNHGRAFFSRHRPHSPS